MNRLSKFTREARQAVAYAREEARRLRHRLVGTEHLLLGLLKVNDPLIDGLLVSMHTSAARVTQALDFVVGRGNKAILSEPILNTGARATLQRAEGEAAAAQADLVGIEHLLLAIMSEIDGIAVGVLESFGVYPAATRQRLADLFHKGYDDLQLAIRYQTLYDTTPMLNQVSRDLTMAALLDELDPLIGRESELERTMQILSRRSKNNPVLIGPAGVGKTAIAEGLALRIIQGYVPAELYHSRVVALDAGLLLVGTKFRGDFEERLKLILQEIIDSPGIITVIDELHLLVQSGVADGSVNAANLFKPLLARGEFQCIGATTLDEYRKTIEADPALERRFQPVLVSETSAGETLEILRGLRSRYEDFHHVLISDDALSTAVQMSSRYLPNRYQPDKALDLLDEAASRVCVQRSVAPVPVLQLRDEMMCVLRKKDDAIARHDFPIAAQLLKRERQLLQELWATEQQWHAPTQYCPTVTQHDIAEIVAMWTGIPVIQTVVDESQRLLGLEHELHQRVIGQDEAVQSVARAVRRSRANIRDHRRPIGSFIFVGPTGVGKTELARALATTLLGDEHAMLKLDMSEFMESHNVSRLIGAPPGYVGYDQGGQLTEAVRRRPYSVVLLDEIEKAHPRIFDLLLQILEDGTLTDASGLAVDFSNTIIIMTSNVGTAHLSQGIMAFTPHRDSAQGYHERINATMISSVKSLFVPELLNRIDEIIVFHSLSFEHLQSMLKLMIAQTQQRLRERSIMLHVSDAASQLLVTCGYDPIYGARPLHRTVQCLLDDMLAEALLQGSLSPGDEILVDAADNRLTLHVLSSSRNEENTGQEAA